MSQQPARDRPLPLSARLRRERRTLAEHAPISVGARVANVCLELALERRVQLIAYAKVSGSLGNARGCVHLRHAKPRFVVVPGSGVGTASTEPPFGASIIHRETLGTRSVRSPSRPALGVVLQQCSRDAVSATRCPSGGLLSRHLSCARAAQIGARDIAQDMIVTASGNVSCSFTPTDRRTAAVIGKGIDHGPSPSKPGHGRPSTRTGSGRWASPTGES
jgi:hypothetical protein